MCNVFDNLTVRPCIQTYTTIHIKFCDCFFNAGATKYLKCPHGDLPPNESRRWLNKGSEQHKALAEIVNDKQLVQNVVKLNHFCHTGSLENFHSVMLKWCPKRIHFTYEGMRARVQLASLCYNENVGHKQATTDKGRLRFKAVLTKTTGHWVAKKISEATTYTTLHELMESIHDARMIVAAGQTPECVHDYSLPKLPKNIAPEAAPDKDSLIAQHMSRMGK